MKLRKALVAASIVLATVSVTAAASPAQADPIAPRTTAVSTDNFCASFGLFLCRMFG